jgi:hypothetical protein
MTLAQQFLFLSARYWCIMNLRGQEGYSRVFSRAPKQIGESDTPVVGRRGHRQRLY